MELDIVKLQTTWNDAAGSINSNYAKIADAIAQLKANGGGGGGGADIDLTDYATKVWVEAKGYITASALTQYALKSDIPSLVGYATEDFVNNKLNAYTTTEDLAENYASKNDLESAINNIDLSPYLKTDDAEDTYATKDFVNNKLVNYAPLTSIQGFENRIGGLEGAVPQLNERVSIVEGEVSSLNETVSTGENNLLDRVNTIETDYVTSGNLESAINGIDLSVYLLKADLTKSRIQSTLGISDWALASVKPTYTASEVGALSLDGTSNMQQSKNIVWSNTEGYEDIDVFSNGLRLLGYNASKGNYGGGIHIGTRYGWQLMTKWGENPLYYRSYDMNSQIWRDWKRLAFTSDIPTKLSQLTDDVVAGKYLPLSEFQVAAVPNPSTVYLQSGIYRQNDGPHLAVGTSGWSQFITLHAEGDNWAQMYFSYDGRLHYRTATFGDGDPANIPWTAIITEKNIGNYNAGSATKLQTPRKLWGNDFDGTAPVSGDLLSDVWRIIKASNWNGTFIQSANYDGTSDLGNIYMSARHGNKLTSFNVWANNSKFSDNVTVAGNVGIGNESPTEKLDVTGNVKASGDITANKFIGSIRGDIIYDNGTDEGHFIGLGSNGVGVKGLLNYVYGNFPILFYTNGFERMRIGDYVGIGTTSPTERLDVSGNIKASGNINATSITINGVTITASNGSITVNGNVLATGDITGFV